MVITKNYFVTIDSREIHEMSTPDGIEFEIIASESELNKINGLFAKLDQSSVDALKYIVKPFNEGKVDLEREQYDNHLMEIYRTIYELGTVETKLKIEQLGLFH